MGPCEFSDITTTLQCFSESDFEAVLDDPPTGIFDRRSWTYWNVRYRREPVPALPTRNLALLESGGDPNYR